MPKPNAEYHLRQSTKTTQDRDDEEAASMATRAAEEALRSGKGVRKADEEASDRAAAVRFRQMERERAATKDDYLTYKDDYESRAMKERDMLRRIGSDDRSVEESRARYESANAAPRPAFARVLSEADMDEAEAMKRHVGANPANSWEEGSRFEYNESLKERLKKKLMMK